MILLLALPVAIGGAGDAPLDRATLRGLKSLNVIIDPIDPELEKVGLTRDALQTRLSSRLRDGGIKVEDGANEFVGLRLLQVRNRRGPYAVALTIGLYQPVLLVRDQKIRTATQTWEVETILLAEPKQLERASLTSVDELAARFISAYRSVNP